MPFARRVPVTAALRLTPEASCQGRKAGTIRKPVHRNCTVSKSRDIEESSHRDLTLRDSEYAYLPGTHGERREEAMCDWTREATAYCTGLRSGPAFLS
jgi:hypothetical protein